MARYWGIPTDESEANWLDVEHGPAGEGADITPEGYSRVINVTDPHPDISPVGAVGDNSTDDNEALQNIFDFVSGGSSYWVWFPFRNAAGNVANYLTSKPLKVWSGTRIMGPATIAPHSTFDWVNHPYWQDPLYNPVGVQAPGDIALIELWNPAVGSGRGSFARLFIEDLAIDCKNQPGSIGLLTKFQQPAYTYKVRIDNADIGWVMWGQQSEHFILDMLHCKIGLYLGSPSGSFDGACKLMSFYTLNIEAFETAAVLTDTEGPNWFYGVHLEGHAGTTAPAFDAKEGIFHVTNGLASIAGPMFVIGDKSPLPGPKNTFYSIRNWQVTSSDATYTQLMLDDKVTGNQLVVGYQRRWHEVSRFFQNDTQVDYDASIQYMGDEGGFVRIGGLKGGTAAPPGHSGAQFTVRPNAAQDERSVRFLDSAGVLRSGVEPTGNLVLGVYTNATRPAAPEVGTMIWNTNDNAPNFSDGSTWRDAAGNIT